MKFWRWLKAFFSLGQTRIVASYNLDRLQEIHQALLDHQSLPHDAIEVNRIQENLMDHISDFEEDVMKIAELNSRIYSLEDKTEPIK